MSLVVDFGSMGCIYLKVELYCSMSFSHFNLKNIEGKNKKRKPLERKRIVKKLKKENFFCVWVKLECLGCILIIDFDGYVFLCMGLKE